MWGMMMAAITPTTARNMRSSTSEKPDVAEGEASLVFIADLELSRLYQL
jgi:hypothetical protein